MDPLESHRRTVLIVDDDPAVLECLRFVFEISGHVVLTAHDEAGAIALLKFQNADAALIDVHMPNRDGFDTWLGIRATIESRGRKLPVWFMSGAPTPLIHQRVAEIGSAGFFKKPFDHVALVSAIVGRVPLQ